ncbi:RseA family anti-sigma factor [Marinospirillum sp.]|uniref:sigma-E factor negative regulatory protein n=1 Tax=Marinospirillum sp. TaxID=2183934 RepID=UPI003A88752C
MTEKLHQSLSAVMDAADDDLELPRLLNAMQSSSELQKELSEKWRRYHLVQGVMRGELRDVAHAEAAQVDLSARIMQQLALESGDQIYDAGLDTAAANSAEVTSAPVSHDKGSWFRGAALAASVAVLAITGVQLVNLPQGPAGSQELVSQPLEPQSIQHSAPPSLQLVSSQPLRLAPVQGYAPPQRFQLVSESVAPEAYSRMRVMEEENAQRWSSGQLQSPVNFFWTAPANEP